MGMEVLWGRDENLKSIVVMVVQLHGYTKNHWSVCGTEVNYMVQGSQLSKAIIKKALGKKKHASDNSQGNTMQP